jgi:dephospho-CoA kinase
MFLGPVGQARAKNRVPIIGVTGPIGAGKSAVSALFSRWGAVVVSGDDIGRAVVDASPSLRRQLARAFGADILRRGHLDRALLAQRAFAGRDGILRLNALVHPPLVREMQKQIRRAQHRPGVKAVVVDAALLVEWGRGKIGWDRLVGVWAPWRIRRARLHRKGWTDRQIHDRARGQTTWAARRQICELVVKNDASVAILQRRARLCWEKMVSLD